MLQWYLYAPAVAGAVNVAVLPPSTLMLNDVPSSEVTVCVKPSLFFTVTVAPDCTEVSFGNVVFWIVMSTPDPESELLFELPLLLHAANANARIATHKPTRIREERVFFFVGMC